MRRALALTAVLAVVAVACSRPATDSAVPAARASGAAIPTAGAAASGPPAPVPSVQLEPCPGTSAAEQPGGEAGLPTLTLPCLGGGPPVRLDHLPAGTPTVVNLWASWCVPCVEELPALQRAHARLGDRVRFLGVLTKDPSRNWTGTLEATGARYPSVRDDPGTLLAQERGIGLPMTLFVRADGVVAFRYVGKRLDDAHLAALLAEHLGVTA